MSVTPGPNNLMLLASGVNYGFQAQPSAYAGHQLRLRRDDSIVMGFGLGQVFEAFSGDLYDIIRYGGRRLHAVAGLEDRHVRARSARARRRARRMTLPAGRAVPVGEPQGLGHRHRRHCHLHAGKWQPGPVLLVALVCGAGEFSKHRHVGHVRHAAAQPSHAARPSCGFSMSRWRCCWCSRSPRCFITEGTVAALAMADGRGHCSPIKS